MIRKLCFLSLVSLLPTVASGLEIFDFNITDFGQFQCIELGFKCGFSRQDFALHSTSDSSHVGAGYFDGATSDVWSPSVGNSSTLTVQGCNTAEKYCHVRCNEGCSCFLQDGVTPCPTGEFKLDEGTGPGTPDNSPGTSNTCPIERNTVLCSRMLDKVPLGQITNFDCFNFCDGKLYGTNKFGETTTRYDCGVNNTVDGTEMGIIAGCTRPMLEGTGPNTAAGTGTSQGVVHHGVAISLTAVAAAVTWTFVV